MRLARHDLDESVIKTYFQLDRIIAAAFDTAQRLFGLRFEELTGLSALPSGHPRLARHRTRAASPSGTFIGDYFARPSKRSGAWMSAFRSQERLSGDILPIIVNVMNFAKGGEGEPSLLSFDDARTLFHEFGHALHGLLSNVTYPLLAGTSVSTDFVELPSQLYEHWLSQPEILRRYATHYQNRRIDSRTAPPAPDGGAKFQPGIFDRRVSCPPPSSISLCTSVSATSLSTSRRSSAKLSPRSACRARSSCGTARPHFAHVFSGDGYSSGYYSYLWSEVLDADAFTAFEETGDAFDPRDGARLKEFIYSAGNLRDPAEAYTAFRGKLPSPQALLAKRGLLSPVSE